MHAYVWLAHKIDKDTYPSFLVSILVLSANTLITVPTGRGVGSRFSSGSGAGSGPGSGSGADSELGPGW